VKLIRLDEALSLIVNEDVYEMTRFFLVKYINKIKDLPASLTHRHHLGETHEEHLKRTVYFSLELAREFNLTQNEKDIVISASILHDIGYFEFVSKKRCNDEYQKLYSTGFNRSREAYLYHPVLGQFWIGKYIVEKRKLLPELFQIAKLVASHMSHWLKECNPEPQSLLEYIVCTADYFASRKEIEIK